MLDRVLKLIVVATLGLFLVQATTGALASVLVAAVKIAGTLLGFIVGIAFLLGLLIQCARFITGHGARGARDGAARERALRQRVRRPSQGVPPMVNRHEDIRDPDPAINDRSDG
jgi:hypothetical protein